MIIRFSGDDLKIYTPSSVFRYTFISLSKYVFARTEPKYSQKNIWANNNYHDNERILSKFAPCRVGNRKTLRGFQTDAALIDTAGLEEEGKQASCRTLALCTGQLLSAHRILICHTEDSLLNCWAPGIHKEPNHVQRSHWRRGTKPSESKTLVSACLSPGLTTRTSFQFPCILISSPADYHKGTGSILAQSSAKELKRKG